MSQGVTICVTGNPSFGYLMDLGSSWNPSLFMILTIDLSQSTPVSAQSTSGNIALALRFPASRNFKSEVEHSSEPSDGVVEFLTPQYSYLGLRVWSWVLFVWFSFLQPQKQDPKIDYARNLFLCVFVVTIPFVARVWKSSVRSVSYSATCGISGCSNRWQWDLSGFYVSEAAKVLETSLVRNRLCKIWQFHYCFKSASDNTHKASAFQFTCLDGCMLSLAKSMHFNNTNNPRTGLTGYTKNNGFPYIFVVFPRSRALSGGTGGRQDASQTSWTATYANTLFPRGRSFSFSIGR